MEKTLAPGAIGVRGLSLAETIDLAARSGFDSVVFDIREAQRLVEAHGIDYLRDLFARAGVRPGYWAVPVAFRQDDTWEEELRRLAPLAALGQDLGCPRATTGIWPGSNGLGFDDNFARHLERMRPAAAALKGAGCRLGIEFIAPKTLRAPFQYEFIHDLPGMLAFARAIGTGNVGLLLDAWHLYTSHGTVTDVERLTVADVVAVHVNDAPLGIPIDEQIDGARALPLATGVIDIVGFMHALQRIGYDGPVMPEPFSDRLNALGATDPVAAAREAAKSMNALWQAAGLE